MGKVLKCRDVGVDCDFEIHGHTDEEILAQAAERLAAQISIRAMQGELAPAIKVTF